MPNPSIIIIVVITILSHIYQDIRRKEYSIMTIENMKDKMNELGYDYAKVAELSGLPLATVQEIFDGTGAFPGYEPLLTLGRLFPDPDYSYLHEPQTAYRVKKQGEYTLDDYYYLPDDIRVELIDGVIYNMTAPSSPHQLIAGFIYSKLLTHVLDKKGRCLPMISPVDVQLDCDDRTMVQPDVIIVCDRDKIINRCVYGAPDFVIEVLSKSSVRRDSVIKLNKYQSAGVHEYWIIDPKRQKVIVHNFEKGEKPAIHGFDAKIPIGIWDDGFEIDFQEVYEHIRFLYEKK